MTIFVVTIELKPGEDTARITERLAQFDSHRSHNFQWLVSSDASAHQLRTDLARTLEPRARMSVFEIAPRAWALRRMQPAADWLNLRGL